jgi:hypothetical protein
VPTSLPAPNQRTGAFASNVGRAMVGAYLLSVTAVCGPLVVNGQQVRAAAEAEQARIVEEENRRLCRKLGMPHGTAGFSECAGYPEEVRKLHAERQAREFAGLL